MRNLKRALSLALASVMLLGMMVVGTSASYADVTSKQNKEAIEVAQAVGVMIGDDKGNFNPDAKVTRVEMAVVMANLLNLKVNDFKAAKTEFTDVPAWAAPYVAACKADGIIAGYSATTFGSNDTVTAAQAALMMMKALGYFQFAPDFGDDWQLATVKQASKIKLYDGISANANTALTRNDVAKLVLNTLKADTVDYTGSQGTNIKLSDGTTVVTGYTIKYYSETAGSADYTTNTTDGDAYQQLCEKLYGSDLKKTSTTDDFGRKASQWKYKTEEIGKYADKADATYTGKVSKATLYNLIGKDAVKALTAATATLTVTVDGKPVTSPAVADYIVDKNTAAAAGTGKGTSTEVYINDNNNNVDIIIINTYLVKATDDYDSKKETVKIAAAGNVVLSLDKNTLSSDDFAVENVKEDDYLLVTCAGTGATKTVKSVEPATVVTGNVDSYSNSSVTIAGTKYEYAVKADTTSTHGTAVTYEIGEDAKVVTDGKYIYYVDEATVSADKYIYVTEIAREGSFTTSGDFLAKAYFLDGTQKTITLKNKYANNDSVTPGPVNTWFAYSVNSSNKYTLTKLGATAAENNASSTATAASDGAVLTENGKVSINGGAIKANAATVFVVVDKDDNVNVYTGVANVPTIKSKGSAVTAYYTYAKNTNYAKYVFIDAGMAAISDASSSSSDFIYLLKYNSTNKDADKNTYYTYKAIVNGEEKKINLSDNFTDSETVYALYTDVKYNDKTGYVDSMNPVDSNDDYTIQSNLTGTVAYEDGVLTIGGQDYVVGKDAKIYLIAADSNVKEDGGATYEVSAEISANTLYSTLKGYTIGAKTVTGGTTINSNYNVQVKDDVMTALYVFVAETTAA